MSTIAFFNTPTNPVQSTVLDVITKGEHTMTIANTSIMAVSEFKTPARTFKDERLAKATQQISDIYSNAIKYVEDKNAEIAKVLAIVASQKSYEKDGFKSVADYAYNVFGIARQKSYALASAGKVYNDTTASPVLRSMPYSKLAAISSVDDKAVQEAIKTGRITSDSTQADLKQFAREQSEKKSAEEPQKVEILKTYTASPCHVFTGDVEKYQDTFESPKTIEEWDEYFTDLVILKSPGHPVEVINLPKGKLSPDSNKATVTRHLYVNMAFSLVVEFYSYVPKTSKKEVPKLKALEEYSIEELTAMLAAKEAAAKEHTAKTPKNLNK